MIRKLLLSFLIAFVVFSAPSNDKMKIVPVKFMKLRDILMITIRVFMQVI